MTIIRVTRLTYGSLPAQPDVDKTLSVLDEQLGFKAGEHLIGKGVQEPGVVQIVACEESESTSGVTLPESESSLPSAPSIESFRVKLNQSPFQKDSYLDADISEYVQRYFPLSKATPQFRAQIETEFDEFWGPLKNATGSRGLLYGWTIDELSHEDIPGEKAVSFFVLAGWNTMKDFEKSVTRKEFKEQFHIILDRHDPGRLWHVQRTTASPIAAQA